MIKAGCSAEMSSDEGVGLMASVLNRVLDSLDVETFLRCADEEEGKRIALQLMEDMGFKEVDVVFIEHLGPGARVRVRAYVHKPGDRYGWLKREEAG